jgi:hypothetical protein
MRTAASFFVLFAFFCGHAGLLQLPPEIRNPKSEIRELIAELTAKERKDHKEVENGLFLCALCVLLWSSWTSAIASRNPKPETLNPVTQVTGFVDLYRVSDGIPLGLPGMSKYHTRLFTL